MSDGPAEKSGPGGERRAVRVSLTFEDFRSFITQYASHISMGGMFIGTRTPLPPGTLCKLDVGLKSGDSLIGGLGEVVWTRDRAQGPERPPGMGVRFRELEDSSRDLVFAIVDRRLVEGGNVFQLDEHGEERVPDLKELLQLAEEHRREAVERTGAPAESYPEEPPGELPGPLPPGGSPREKAVSPPDLLPEVPNFDDDGPESGVWEEGFPESRAQEDLTPEEPAPKWVAAEEAVPEKGALREPGAAGGEDGPFGAAGFEESAFGDGGFDETAFGDDSFEDEEAVDESAFDESVFDDELEEDTPEETGLTEIPGTLAAGKSPQGSGEVDFERRQGVLAELYPGLAERLQAAEGGEAEAQSTEEVLVSLQEPVPPSPARSPEPPGDRPEEITGEAPAPGEPFPGERGSGAGTMDEAAAPPPQARRELPTEALPAIPSEDEPAERFGGRKGMPARPAVPEPALPPEAGWSSYAFADPSDSRRRWLWVLVALLVAGGAFVLWQRSSGPSPAAPPAADLGEGEGDEILEPDEPSPSAGAGAGSDTETGAAGAEGAGEPPVTVVLPEPAPPPAPADPSPPPASTPEPPAETREAMTRLLEVAWQAVPEGTRVTLRADGEIPPGSFDSVRIGSGNPRLLIRLRGIRDDPRKGRIDPRTAELQSIRTGFHPKAGGNEVHVVLDLGGAGVKAARVEAQGDSLQILLSASP